MELEFDNEIDALLRKEAAAKTITISEFAGVHLDADEIAAFVDNAVPVHTRTGFIRHFAGCDRCRKALSHAAVLHLEEAEPAGSIVAPVAEVHVPWYRRLFLFPNLAYVMGGLIVMFAGFISISVYNSGVGSGEFEMSKSVSSGEPVAAESERNYAANTNSMSQPMANASSNTANTAVAADDGLTSADSPNESVALQKGPSPSDSDELRGAPLATPAMQPPSPSIKESPITADGIDENKRVEKLPTSGRNVQDLQVQPKDKAKAEERKAPLTMAPSAENSRNTQATQNVPLTAKGPSAQRNDNRLGEQRNAQLSRDREADTALKAPAKKTDSTTGGRAGFGSDRKQVSGKTFVFKQGAWYDTVYNGQGTINVRRRTESYKKLDSGLRGIAESIIGTVVTVWNGKAYRID